MEQLSDEQLNIFNAYTNNLNVFMTGSAGHGKSFLIKVIKQHAARNFKNIAVCALTGVASLNIGGRTLHSFGSLGVAQASISEVVDRVVSNKWKSKNWKNVDVLVIDEISMMSAKLFDICNQIAKKVRKNNKPWGGIQLIFSGDFYQLAPIFEQRSSTDTGQFCFESSEWASTFPITYYLTKSFRHPDIQFKQLLDKIRTGDVSDEDCKILETRVGVKCNDMIKPIHIVPTRKEADYINNKNLNKINEPEYKFSYDFEYTDKGVLTKKDIDKLPNNIKFELDYQLKNLPIQSILKLKKSMQVMCVANINLDIGLVNGTMGIINDFNTQGNPVVKFENIESEVTINYHSWSSEYCNKLTIKQIPLIPAFSITCHKIQSLTLNKATINGGSNIFTTGQLYVALSRVRTLEGVYLTEFDKNSIMVNNKVIDFYKKNLV